MSTPFYSFAIPVLEKGERCKLMRVRTSSPVPVCTLDTVLSVVQHVVPIQCGTACGSDSVWHTSAYVWWPQAWLL